MDVVHGDALEVDIGTLCREHVSERDWESGESCFTPCEPLSPRGVRKTGTRWKKIIATGTKGAMSSPTVWCGDYALIMLPWMSF